MTEAASAGDWVDIHRIVLAAGERAAQMPSDTQETPLEMRVKGCIVVVQETEYTGAGKHPISQLNFARDSGVELRRGDPRDDRPGQVIVIPEHPSQLRAIDLDRIRQSYLRNAFASLPSGEAPSDADIAFLAADSRTNEAYVRRALS